MVKSDGGHFHRLLVVISRKKTFIGGLKRGTKMGTGMNVREEL